MKLTERVKSFFSRPSEKDLSNHSSTVKTVNVINDLSNADIYPNSGSFFDNETNGSMFGTSEAYDMLQKQKTKIMKYRALAGTPEVAEAIDEIVNEVIFVYDDKDPLKIDINEENETLRKAITDKFKKITKLMNLKRNLYNIVKNSYIDGQIIVYTGYDKNSTTGGITNIKTIEPVFLYYDSETDNFKYLNKEGIGRGVGVSSDITEEYDIEEICREDFGIYDGKLTLSYLDYAIKPANMLNTLEDLLVPLRFSRSISRRVFNVDIGDLPGKRGKEVMQEYQNKFKYKKFYNSLTGEVSNQQHITSMVEDYWFSNRSGGKGTSVDVLDESGNLGELDDIIYFSKKLYRSLKIPTSRISMDKEADSEFDYSATNTTKQDLKFFMFISRIRQVYSSLFKEILKREIISTGVMTEQEWFDKEDLIKISFVNENQFIEKMNLDNFMSKLDIYSSAAEQQGKLFSVDTILKQIFKLSDEEITEEFKKIAKEEKNPLYAKFYTSEDY